MRGKLISASIQRTKYVLCDLLMTGIAFCLFNVYRYFILHLATETSLSLFSYLGTTKLVMEQIFIPVCMLGLYWLSGYYNRPFDKSRLQEFVTTIFSSLLGSLLIYLALLTNDFISRAIVNYEMLLTLFLLLLFFLYLGRFSITQNAINKFYAHRWSINTVVVGNSRMARETAYRLARSSARLGYNILGFVSIPGERDVNDDRMTFSMDELPSLCEEGRVDQIIISTDGRDEEKVLQLLSLLFPLGVPIKITPDTFSYVTSGIRLQDIYGEPFIDLAAPSTSESAKNIKRFLDVLFSALALVILSPLLGVVAILVKRSSPGPVIYSQERVGYRKRPFRIYKFRSMYTDAEASGPRLSTDGDSRITPLGRILRKYRIDELPQFWNVLKGDMSLVGPRPERAYFIEQIVKYAPYYTLVSQVRPGITSWGMVKYGYASSVEQMVERTRFDLIYLSNMSTLVDFKIMIYTVKTVLTGRGV
ncbi:MAG: sugar transferase [Bacteroidales bacterium]|nr:sugar transferase [Bacteroidales bacterium]